MTDSLGRLVLLREVGVPGGKDEGGDSVRHDVGRLVREEVVDAHGGDGEARAHLVPDLRRQKKKKKTHNKQQKNIIRTEKKLLRLVAKKQE